MSGSKRPRSQTQNLRIYSSCLSNLSSVKPDALLDVHHMKHCENTEKWVTQPANELSIRQTSSPQNRSSWICWRLHLCELYGVYETYRFLVRVVYLINAWVYWVLLHHYYIKKNVLSHRRRRTSRVRLKRQSKWKNHFRAHTQIVTVFVE